MSDLDFLALLGQPEGETIDFKLTFHDFATDKGKGDFVRDILAMSNTPRSCSAYIIVGVKDTNGSRTLVGASTTLDEVAFQSQLRDRVYPVPVLRFSVHRHENKDFGVIELPPEKYGPCTPVRTNPQLKLFEGQVWFRRGSSNDIAKSADLQRILAWINGQGVATNDGLLPTIAQWPEFIEAVHNFAPDRRYLLVTHPFDTELAGHLSSLGKVPWAAVIDFDIASDITGLYATVSPTLGLQRNIHKAVLGARPAINFNGGTYWYFARGLSGREETIELGPWRKWVNRYQNELTTQFNGLAASLSPSPVTCVVLWHHSDLADHIDTVLQTAYGAFGDALEVILITGDNFDISQVCHKFSATSFAIPWDGLARGVDASISLDAAESSGKCLLPGSHGEPVHIPHDKALWLREELELVDLRAGKVLPETSDPRRDFLRGAEISWFGLGAHCDVDRDKTARLKTRIESELRSRRTSRVNLYHAPGGGGTSVAKRVLWDLHEQFPALILHRTRPNETTDRLFTITSCTNQPAVVLIDGSQIAERDVDDLYQVLSSRHIPVVILQVLRRFQPQNEGPRAVYLPAELTLSEAYRFVEQFAAIDVSKRPLLEVLLNGGESRTRTAFYFGLTTFGKDFVGITPYVEHRLRELSVPQRQIACSLALAHHYAQRAMPAQAFGHELGLPPTAVVKFVEALPMGLLELLINTGTGQWRTAHDLIAEEVLIQIMTPEGADRRNWRQQLSQCAIDFAHKCRGHDTVISGDLLEVAQRTFIFRDNANMLGTEKAGTNRFSQLVEDIPSQIGRENVLRELAEIFPDEAHFQAHLARFYAFQVRDYSAAKEYIDRAIAIRDSDHVLHHVRGMVLRSQVYESLEQDDDLNEIIKLAESAVLSFERSRSINPDNEHGYISEAQMLIRIMDHCASKHPKGLLGFLSQANVFPLCHESVERTEDLLDHVRSARESEGESPFEQDCRARLRALFSDHETALSTWNSLLDPNKGIYKPPIRRQLVWTYLRRRGSWDTLPPKEVARIVELLQDNLNEEPNKDTNLRLWVRAVRRLEHPPSPQQVIEKLAYWKANSGSLEATYYLYVLYSLLVVAGNRAYHPDALRHMEECKRASQFRQKRTKSYEWYGRGTGLGRLVHQSVLGEWDKTKEFWERVTPLERINGVIVEAANPQKGTIEVQGGLQAFFVPSRGDFHVSKSENQRVTLYLGFSLDGLRAWEVVRVE